MKQTKLKQEIPMHLMIIPSILLLLVFSYIPILGNVIAFEKYYPTKGILNSKWIGLDNFIYLFKLPNIYQVLFNTVYISIMKIVAGIVVPVTYALLLNEVRKAKIKKTIQTIIYFPHFLSWVILTGILVDILSPSQGIINQALKSLGSDPIFFLGNKNWFPYILVITDVWKEFGFGTIIYLAALAGIDPMLYEASAMDGAGRLRQTWHITLPGITPIVTLMTVLSLGSILNAGFDQIFNLYSPIVYSSGDIIDTFVYRIGLKDIQFGVSTAAGFLRSFVSLAFVTLSFKLAHKFTGYRII